MTYLVSSRSVAMRITKVDLLRKKIENKSTIFDLVPREPVLTEQQQREKERDRDRERLTQRGQPENPRKMLFRNGRSLLQENRYESHQMS